MSATMGSDRGPVPVRDVAQEILDVLENKDVIKSSVEFADVPQAEFRGAVARLNSRSMVQYNALDSEEVLLTDEGQSICDEGSHEYKVWYAVWKRKKLEMKELPVCPINSGFRQDLMRMRAVLTVPCHSKLLVILRSLAKGTL